MKKEVNLKDVLLVTVTEARKSVKNLTDKQVTNIMAKLNKLTEIVGDESNSRFAIQLEAEADQVVEDEIDETDEV